VTEKKQTDVDPHEVTTAEQIRPGKLIAGAPIGGYSLLGVLGEGGMGVVWSAHDPLLDRTLAIKVLRRGDAAPQLRMRLLREARAMARLKHPNVLTVYEVGTEGERDFIAMELVEGGSVDQWLARGPTRADVISTIVAAGRGLAAAHAAGLVHRDFKPHNILRSNDGRVLVTDFGLARGLGEDSPVSALTPVPDSSPIALDLTMDASASSSKPSLHTDSLLDSPLTKTGAMIGTPAYMAPEQFMGAPPDRRTDQFAFCVTAWQALTGIRPYHGTTLDELRRAASVGVANVVVDLPKPLRAVLVRGLDPDPAKRWPDLDALLEALEHAGRERSRKRWPYVAAGCAAIAAIAVGVMMTRKSEQPAAVVCEPADSVFAGAWSDDMRAKLRRTDVAEPVVARVTGAFDDYRRKWIADYEQACKEPKPSRAHVECSRALREQVAAMSQLLQAANRETFEAFDPYMMLSSPATCSGKSPVGPTTIPDDQPRRNRILGALAKTIALRTKPDLAAAFAELEGEARSIGWPPLLAEISLAAGTEHVRRHDIPRGRELLARVVSGTDMRRGASARLGLLAAATIELEHPGDYPNTKPDAIHEELSRQLTYARAAVKAAGDEPLLLGQLAFIEAEIEAELAKHSARKLAFGNALGLAAEARHQFETAGDVKRLANAAALEASIDLDRWENPAGYEHTLDDALFAARSANEALERAHLPHSPALDEIRARVAFARGDFVEAHTWFDRLGKPAAISGASHTGVVLDASGKPAAGATVVAWTGNLHGDPRYLSTDPRELHGEAVETAADGTFVIHAGPGAAIAAQHGDLRSAPELLAAGSPTLRLAPTVAVSGKVDTKNAFGVDAFARFSIGDATWFVHVPIEKDFAFHLARLPRGTPLFGTISHGRRLTAASVTKLVWPAQRLIDVVVRAAAFDDAARVWVFREYTAPRTRADAELLEATATEAASGKLHRIGMDATDAGRALYASGDRHALVPASADGYATACVAIGPTPTAPVSCKKLAEADTTVLLDAP
jgi:predicted Ser/Thr protein kinase